MTGLAAGPTAEQAGLRVLVVSAVAALVAGYLADQLKLESNTALAVAAVAGMTPNGVALLRRHRRIGRQQELEAISRGDLARPPLLVVGVLGFALLFLDSLFGAVAGYATVAVTGGDTSNFSSALGLLSRVYSMPLLVFSTYLLARYAAHYLARHATLWLAASVGLFVALRLIVIVINLNALHVVGIEVVWLQLVATLAVLASVLVFVSWLGKLRADSTHSQFVVGRLFRRLGTEDRLAALDLLREPVLTRALQRER